ncbi:hypothetical protein KKF63_10265 [bacterium]|nr:hypothetical protein [bacterium]
MRKKLLLILVISCSFCFSAYANSFYGTYKVNAKAMERELLSQSQDKSDFTVNAIKDIVSDAKKIKVQIDAKTIELSYEDQKFKSSYQNIYNGNDMIKLKAIFHNKYANQDMPFYFIVSGSELHYYPDGQETRAIKLIKK